MLPRAIVSTIRLSTKLLARTPTEVRLLLRSVVALRSIVLRVRLHRRRAADEAAPSSEVAIAAAAEPNDEDDDEDLDYNYNHDDYDDSCYYPARDMSGRLPEEQEQRQ